MQYSYLVSSEISAKEKAQQAPSMQEEHRRTDQKELQDIFPLRHGHGACVCFCLHCMLTSPFSVDLSEIFCGVCVP